MLCLVFSSTSSSPPPACQPQSHTTSRRPHGSLALRVLKSQCQTFLTLGSVASSRRTDSAGQRKFFRFVQLFPSLFPSPNPFPASEYQLMMFASWLASSFTPATVRVYIAAVRSLHIDLGFPDPTLNAHRLHRVTKGIQRIGCRSRPLRRPVTHETLLAILASLQASGPSYDAVMFGSACCIAFYGFLRVSEFTSSVPFNPNHDLSLADITFLPTAPVPQLRLTIKQSKTDPFGHGCYVYLAQTSRAACPVTALRAYLAVRGPAPGPLFIWSDGSPLIAAQVNYYLHALLNRAGVSGYYTSHSFRIGAATSAAAAGVPDHLIQALSRWSSTAYLQYIRTSPDILVDALARL